jgi:hypothetical protein
MSDAYTPAIEAMQALYDVVFDLFAKDPSDRNFKTMGQVRFLLWELTTLAGIERYDAWENSTLNSRPQTPQD